MDCLGLQGIRRPQVELGEGAALRHGYLQLQGADARHMKGTFVGQAARSSYTLTEACVGASLARHDIAVDQVPSILIGRPFQ